MEKVFILLEIIKIQDEMLRYNDNNRNSKEYEVLKGEKRSLRRAFNKICKWENTQFYVGE